MATPRKIIIDTDPGVDDAAALMLALASPETLEVIGITTVAGNVSVDQATTNALTICALCGAGHIAVFPGAGQPLRRAAVYGHGSGLDGLPPQPPAPRAQTMQASAFLASRLAAENRGAVTICALGPLTNIAELIVAAPEAARRVAGLIVMGGAFAGGNVTPYAEFNIHADPDAADIVFRSGIPIVLAPLDVTRQIIVTPDRTQRLQAMPSRAAAALAAMLAISAPFYRARYGLAGPMLHDPAVIAYALRPDLFTGAACQVAVETAAAATLGMITADWQPAGTAAHVTVLQRIEANDFFALFFERLRRYG